MGTNEDGDHEIGRDWLDGRRGLDRESLERVEADRELDTAAEPGLLARLSRLRRAASTPLRVAAGGIRWATARLPRNGETEEATDRSRPIADGSATSIDGDHHVGTRTGRPDPETPDIQDQSEFTWGGDSDPEPTDGAGEERPAGTAADD